MNEIEFLNSIDACFPYDKKDQWKDILEEALKISDNAVFMVLHEICRVPKNRQITPQTLLDLLRLWSVLFSHPLKDDFIPIAQHYIQRQSIAGTEILSVIKKLAIFPGLYAALDILSFAQTEEENEEAIENHCEAIRILWERKKS